MNFTLVDLETGGLVADSHAIMSVGLMRLYGNLDPIEERYWLVSDPLKIVTKEAVAVNHLEIDHATATPVDQLLAELGGYFQDTVLVAHNAPFDIGWLNNRGNYGILEAVDTMMLSWKYWPHPQKAKLGILAERLGLKIQDAHNSLGDVLTMAGCLKALADRFGEEVLQPKPIDWWFWANKYRGTKPQWVPKIAALSQT
jgi:DNA polymerase-3 subunit alpha (Gram-positive type)